MPTFLHPALLWGLPIVAVPVLIHLINMMRHHRVHWAAMEFLLVSQKRNRTWILLKQFLLLLMRMATVAAVVLVVAQPVLRGELGSLFGRNKTHHIVLLDDSFSMSDRWGDTSAFAEARQVIERIAHEAGQQAEPQTFTLLRFSQAGRTSLGTQPDLHEEQIDSQFDSRLREVLERLESSHLAVGPTAALEAIEQLLGDENDEKRIVYLVSDFRAREWSSPGDLKNRLRRLNELGARLHLVNCVDAVRPNLAISELRPAEGTRAAGVPLYMEVGVQNFGPAPARNVSVLVSADDLAQPAVHIAEIPAGKAVRQRFPVHFATAGEHRVAVRLETDAVEPDNFRYRVLKVPADVPVLIVDGDPEAVDARYLAAALAPGGPVQTGISPQIEKPRYLSLNPLETFRSIYLLNIERLDESAVDALESYLSAGGGVGVFLGPRSSARVVNEQFYRDGRGFFPVPVAGEATLAVDRLQNAPDVEVGQHPIFRVFAGGRNDFLSSILVSRYFAVPRDWKPAENSGVEVIAKLRNRAPLMVERAYGDGRVIAAMTTLAPTWNNWARNNPSFVIVMLEMQSHLARRPKGDDPKAVGAPLVVELDPSRYEPQVRFTTPNQGATAATPGTATPTAQGILTTSLPDTALSGIYEVELVRKDGEREVRLHAFNVDAAEGDLKTVGGPELASRLQGVDYEYNPAAMFQHARQDMAGFNLAEPILFALILLLIGEQILAWSASYHPPAGRPVPRTGGAA